ncbi:MAG TPA: hypothetical protein VKE70_36105 [Candidatus Solibacter sp.]|nr:hypothetical protein [Candidatus Solibacter sp.]
MQSYYEFNSRSYGLPIYNVVVVRLLQRTSVLACTLMLLFAVTLGVSLLLIPRPHSPLQYMVAGSLATAITLAGGFAAMHWLGGQERSDRPVVRIRIARRSGQSS